MGIWICWESREWRDVNGEPFFACGLGEPVGVRRGVRDGVPRAACKFGIEFTLAREICLGEVSGFGRKGFLSAQNQSKN